MDKLKLNLCSGCVLDLIEYNPYIFEDGSPRPIDSLDITVVPVELCANSLIENTFFEKEKNDEQ